MATIKSSKSSSLSTTNTNSAELSLSSSESINELIQCPICYDPMMNEIFICSNGHSICNQCKHRLNSNQCPSCKENYNCCKQRVNRNLTLENLIYNTLLPCKYSHNGCDQLTIGKQRDEHLKLCKHRPIPCPFHNAVLPLFSECLYSTNNLDQLLKHCVDAHQFDIFENPNNIFHFQLDDITEGSGHYRIILKSNNPDIISLLVGFKSQAGSIVLFVRSFKLLSPQSNKYSIQANFESDDGILHSIKWESFQYSILDEVGLEFRQGLLLKLSREQVRCWQNKSSDSEQVPLSVIVGNV